MSDTRVSIEKLKGRENFGTWKVAITPESSPNTNAQVIRELTLSIESSLYSYIEDNKSTSVVWKGLLRAFDDLGVARKVTILNQLVSIRLKQ